MTTKKGLWIVIILLSVTYSYSQNDTSKVQRITLTDGSKLIGKIVSDSTSKVVFRTSSGVQMEIDKSSIEEIKFIEGEWVKGEFIREDPNQTRLFFAPTARALKQGRGYFSAYEIFFPMLAIGITDFITLAGGMSLFPGASEQIIYIAPKVRLVHLDNFDLAGGVLYMSVSDHTFGITYGVATVGTSTASLTLGLGWGFVDSELSDDPSLVIGGEVQLSNSIKLITENWFPPKMDGGLVSFGIRFFGESIAGDFGLMRSTNSSSSGFPFLPWVGFVYNF
jgi:hypothetical protein